MRASDARRSAPWALALLTLIYALNFADRQLLAITLEDVKRDIGATDLQMGLLTGTTFALFYTFAGIPLARLADRGARWRLLSFALFAWSAFTSLTALARSFTHLALARIGVGVGESACSPCAHSLLSDMYSPARRATAIAVYSTGIYVGTFLAYEVGGWLCKEHGWTAAFAWFGVPGIVLAVLALVAMREPPRTGLESSKCSSEAQLAELWRSRPFRHLALGAGIKSIAGYALLTWVPTFFTRVHGLDSQEVGSWLGPIVGLGGAIGTFGGGWIADLLGQEAPRRRLLSAAWATLAATPFLYAFLFAATPVAAFWFYLPASILGAMYLGPAFAFAQDCAQPGQRALASAVLLFLVNLIGLGLGPYVVGALSDFFAASQGPAALRFALAIVSVSYVWGAAHLAQAARIHGAQAR